MIAALKRLNWIHVVFIVLIHALALMALLERPRLVDVTLLVVLYLATGFGVTIGFHRLIAHRGFVCPAWLRGTLAFFGTASLQGGPISWTMNHRRHHQVSDQPQDPHTPTRGFFFAHVGWIFLRVNVKRLESLVKDLGREPFMRWLDRPVPSIVPAFTLGLLCYLIGGVQGLLWGCFLRTVLMWHATWCVNSVCHTFGSRMYATPDLSRNCWWVGLVALGEGWHNNHHARPRCAFHGHAWWQIDFSSMVIRTMEFVGLARNVVEIPRRDQDEPLEVAS